MKQTRKIEVCANCSGIGADRLRGKGSVKVGCIGKCRAKFPELAGKVFGFVNGEFVVTDTEEAFLQAVDARGAYVPQGNRNPLVDAFLSSADKWQEEFRALREIVLRSGLTEELKWGQPCYTLKGRNVIILGGFRDYVALTFFKGVLLSDPEGILIQQTENIREARQLRFTGAGEIERIESVIERCIAEAIEAERSGLALPETGKTDPALPEELRRKFDESPEVKAAFYALTPGRQRGYLYYFSGAKQSKTRASRIERCLPDILRGKGLND